MSIANDNSLNSRALFCTACGSADVVASSLAGGEASCNVCSWKGKVEELAVLPFGHNMGDAQQVFRSFFLEIRTLMSMQFGRDFGALLIKWGFLEQPTPKNADKVRKVLARYVAGAAKAILESVAKTRADIEKEEHRESPSA